MDHTNPSNGNHRPFRARSQSWNSWSSDQGPSFSRSGGMHSPMPDRSRNRTFRDGPSFCQGSSDSFSACSTSTTSFGIVTGSESSRTGSESSRSVVPQKDYSGDLSSSSDCRSLLVRDGAAVCVCGYLPGCCTVAANSTVTSSVHCQEEVLNLQNFKSGADAFQTAGKAVGEEFLFSHFFVLALDKYCSNLPPDDDTVFAPEGARFLAPFVCSEFDVIDMYVAGGTSISTGNGPSACSFDPSTLSPFCFPRGVRARLFPKSAIDRATAIGWLGRSADTYQVLVLTDGSGVAKYGVVITVQEEVANETELQKCLVLLRRRQRAALLISRWWLRCGNRGKWRRFSVSSAGCVDSRRSSTALSSTSFGDSLGTKSNLTRLLKAKVKSKRQGKRTRRVLRKLRLGAATLTSTRGEKDNSQEKSLQHESKKREGKRKTLRKSRERTIECRGRKMSGATVLVYDIMNNFIETSPIPRYDKKNETGIWRAARLKVSRETDSCTVIIRHAVLNSYLLTKNSVVRSSKELVDAERCRLRQLLVDANAGVKKIIFEEIDDCGKRKSRVATDICSQQQDTNHVFPPKVRVRANEAFEEMVSSEKLGDTCVVEKAYVLLGGKLEELSLLFATLQVFVDSERELCAVTHQEPGNLNSQNGEQGGFPFVPVTRSHGYHEVRRMVHSSNSEEFKFMQQVEGAPGCRKTWTSSNLCPQVIKEWGIAILLLRLGSRSLMKLLKLMLVERSVLIIGMSTEEVSCCTCTLLTLLAPYKWEGTFLPMMPESLLDFLHSPVPLVAGVVCGSSSDIRKRELDCRIRESVKDGLVKVNLDRGSLSMALDLGMDNIMSAPPHLIKGLNARRTELVELATDPNSSVKSLKEFVRKGLSCKESAIVHSVREDIFSYIANLAGDLAKKKDTWKRYGEFNRDTNDYHYSPELFLGPRRAELEFLEGMVHTQLFFNFVESRRKACKAKEERQE